MSDLIIGLIGGFIVWQLFGAPMFVFGIGINPHFNTLDFVIFNPIQLYDNTHLNHFGAWFLALFACLVFPLWSIPYWIYKAFTVGG